MLKACGVRPHSFLPFCSGIGTGCSVPQFPGAVNIFWVFYSTVHSKEMSVRVKLTGNSKQHIHTTYRFKLAVLTHTRKSTSTHKVQESASRTAIGAELPKDLILVSCVLHYVSHLHSKVQSSPVHPKPRWDCPFLSASSPYVRTAVSFSLSTPLPAASVQVSSVKSLLLPSETQASPWSREIS